MELLELIRLLCGLNFISDLHDCDKQKIQIAILSIPPENYSAREWKSAALYLIRD